MDLDYPTLNAMSAESFRNPELFRTSYDAKLGDSVREKHYRTGLEVSTKSREVIIAANGIWEASRHDGSRMISYEGIGYHSCTADLLRGFLDGPAPLVIYRYNGNAVERHLIKEATRSFAAKDD